MKKVIYLSLILAVALIGCKKEISKFSDDNTVIQTVLGKANATIINTFYGPQVQLGNGQVRTFVSISHDGIPQELGLKMTSSVFDNLPVTMSDISLPFHHKAKEFTPYDHIFFGWMPSGHPSAVFSVPHFDMHFYMLSTEEQMAIPAPTPANASLFSAPPAGYMPDDYTVPFAAIPMMGRHWIDRTSTIFSPGAIFTHEFMYGTFNRKVAFLEPMIAKAFLLAIQSGANAEVHQTIKQPTIFDPTGTYYPTQYNIYSDSKGNIYISLDQFVLR